MVGKKTCAPVGNHLRRGEIQALLAAPDPTTRSGIRDRAMVHLCFAAGLRVSELVSLPMAGLSLHPSPLVRVNGKGRRERALPLWEETATDFRPWSAVRTPHSRVAEVFVTALGQPRSRYAVGTAL